MNRKYTTIILTTGVIALIAVAIFLLVDRTSAKAFSDLTPNVEQFDTCQITCVTVDREDEITLTGDALTSFVSQLEQQEYYKRGSYGNTMEGTIYHVYFSSAQSEPFEMKISDLGKVYIGSNCYEFSPDVNPDVISSYIEALLK